MARNSKATSAQIAKVASQTLKDNQASTTARSLAASALSQKGTSHQTGASIEDLASKVLRSDKYADTTKQLAASVLSQSNKDR